MAVAGPDEIEYGEVFTRGWVVDAILDLVGYTADRDLTKLKLVEPSIGSGAFFIPVATRLIQSAKRYGVGLSSLSDVLFGLDLQPEHVKASRHAITTLLVEAGASNEEAEVLAGSWLHQGDFLLDAVPQNVDFVVGNPPYIRTEDLDDEVETLYRNRWHTMKGRADIYVGFYQRSLEILAPGGRLGFICADRWMRNAYGKRLRNLVSNRYAVETVWQMHDVDAFETEVSAYPAITVLANAPQGGVAVVDTTHTFGEASAQAALAFGDSGVEEATGEGWEGARLAKWFETDDFWPTGSPHMIKMLERLQEDFPTLESDGVTKISIGVATGADKAYIVSKDAAIDVEPDRLMPIVMADDIRAGQLTTPTKMLLNPWDSDGKLVPLDQYPKFAALLSSHASVKERFVARRNPLTWYRTIDKVYPGIAKRPKLLLQDMKAQITPVFEPGGYYPHHNLYYVTSSSWDLEVLGGILLSKIAEEFIRAYGVKMRGGTLRFQAQYLRKIRVPSPGTIPADIAARLKDAFRKRDRDLATRAAEEAYGLPAGSV